MERNITLLDEFAPEWQFHETHRIHVHAPADRVYHAIQTVTAREIRFFRALVWLRRLGRPGPASILNPPPDVPLLEVATQSGFLLLAAAPREIVVGTVLIAPPGAARPATPDQYRTTEGAGWAKATMNFLIEERGSSCEVRTATRVHVTDARTRRRLRSYWWLIRPGSGLIRRMSPRDQAAG